MARRQTDRRPWLCAVCRVAAERLWRGWFTRVPSCPRARSRVGATTRRASSVTERQGTARHRSTSQVLLTVPLRSLHRQVARPARSRSRAASSAGEPTSRRAGRWNDHQQPDSVDVIGLTGGAIGISAGEDHSLPSRSAGAAKCWGNNGFGSLGNDSNTSSSVPVDVSGLSSGVASISAGGGHTCAVTGASVLKCWGENFWGQVGDGSTSTAFTPVTVAFNPPDTTAPTITLTTPPDGASYTLGVSSPDYSCADEAGGSGLASCVGTVMSGTTIVGTVLRWLRDRHLDPRVLLVHGGCLRPRRKPHDDDSHLQRRRSSVRCHFCDSFERRAGVDLETLDRPRVRFHEWIDRGDPRWQRV